MGNNGPSQEKAQLEIGPIEKMVVALDKFISQVQIKGQMTGQRVQLGIVGLFLFQGQASFKDFKEEKKCVCVGVWW